MYLPSPCAAPRTWSRRLLLADYFVKKYAGVHKKNINRISTPAIDMLSAYHWPGTCAKLENVIERAVLIAAGTAVEGHDLPPTLQMKEVGKQGIRKDSFDSLVASYESELIVDALKDARGSQTRQRPSSDHETDHPV